MNDVRERRSQPLVTNAAAAAARNRPGAAATPTTEATTEDGRVETIHYGVQCDTCDVNPVRGTRYKSVAHDDFDLCATCFAAGRVRSTDRSRDWTFPFPRDYRRSFITKTPNRRTRTSERPVSRAKRASPLSVNSYARRRRRGDAGAAHGQRRGVDTNRRVDKTPSRRRRKVCSSRR